MAFAVLLCGLVYVMRTAHRGEWVEDMGKSAGGRLGDHPFPVVRAPFASLIGAQSLALARAHGVPTGPQLATTTPELRSAESDAGA